MEALYLKRTKFLEDFLEYYQGFASTRRNKYKSRGRWTPIATSKGCAISRYLPLELSKFIDKQGLTSVHNDTIFNLLPAELKELGQDFLLSMQSLHDTDEFWDGDILSLKGHAEMNALAVWYFTSKFI